MICKYLCRLSSCFIDNSLRRTKVLNSSEVKFIYFFFRSLRQSRQTTRGYWPLPLPHPSPAPASCCGWCVALVTLQDCFCECVSLQCEPSDVTPQRAQTRAVRAHPGPTVLCSPLTSLLNHRSLLASHPAVRPHWGPAALLVSAMPGGRTGPHGLIQLHLGLFPGVVFEVGLWRLFWLLGES